MKKVKRLISVLLALCTTLTILPANAWAVETNAAGDKMPALTEKSSGSEPEILGLSVEGKTAVVRYQYDGGSALAGVAVYDKSTGQMLTYGSASISAEDNGEISLPLRDDLPEVYTASAFLLEPGTMKPLCDKFEIDSDDGLSEKETIYSITKIEMTPENGDTQAIVTVNINSASRLRVDFWEDQPLEDINLSEPKTALVSVTARTPDYCEQETVAIPIHDELPEYYVIHATLEDLDGNPLSDPFICIDYTSEYAQFSRKTIEDFKSEEGLIVNFDEDDTNNFGVLNPDVITVTMNDTDNLLYVTEISNDEDEGFIVPEFIYEFTNPDETILSLQRGDCVYIEGTSYLFKVDRILYTADSVTILPSDEVELTDFYSFLKVDLTGTEDKSEILRAGIDTSLTQSHTESINWHPGGDEDVTVTGLLSESTKTDIKISYDIGWGDSYVELSVKPKVELSFTGSVSVKNPSPDDEKEDKKKGKDELPIGKMAVPSPVPGLSVYVKPSAPVEFSLSGKISVNFKTSQTTGFTYNSKSGIQTFDKKESSASLDSKVEAELKIGPKITLGASFIEIVDVSVNAQAGIIVSLSESVDLATSKERDSLHACSLCLDGTSKVSVTVDAKLKIDLPGKSLDYTKTLNIIKFEGWISLFKDIDENTADEDKKKGKFYISILNSPDSPFGGKFHMAGGTCPNKKWKTVFKAEDTDGNALNDIEVRVTGDEGRVSFIGKTAFYEFLYNGEYTAKCTIHGTDITENFTVNKAKQDVLLREGRILVFGAVTDAVTGEGISGAAVVAVSPDGAVADRAVTIDNGNYELRLPPGVMYTFQFSADSYESKDMWCLVDGVMDYSVDAELNPKTGTLRGVVTDVDTGEPVAADITISALDNSYTYYITANAEGEYQHALPPGTYKVEFSADGYQSSAVEKTVVAGVSTTLDVELKANAHRYKRFDLGMTWTEAKAYCENIGGHLVTITSADEQSYVASLVAAGTQNQYWLGGYKDGSWQWVTDEAWGYSHWASGEPNNYRKNESYAQIYRIRNPHSGGAALYWNDISVDNHISGEEDFFTTDKVGFICEWE